MGGNHAADIAIKFGQCAGRCRDLAWSRGLGRAFQLLKRRTGQTETLRRFLLAHAQHMQSTFAQPQCKVAEITVRCGDGKGFDPVQQRKFDRIHAEQNIRRIFARTCKHHAVPCGAVPLGLLRAKIDPRDIHPPQRLSLRKNLCGVHRADIVAVHHQGNALVRH